MPSLTSEERSFFTLVQQAIAANPFSRERNDLDLKIAGRYEQPQSTRNIEQAVQEVGRRIEELERHQTCHIKRFTGRDRELVKSAFLFHTFHRFIPQFDRLITEQSQQPDLDLPVPFADQALNELKTCGFTAKEARRYFELFFQKPVMQLEPHFIFRCINKSF